NEITALTYPEVGDFLRTYVGGNKSLPYAEMFEKVGVSYNAEEKYSEIDMGVSNPMLGVNQETGKLFMANEGAFNDFSRAIGFKEGDQLLQINDNDIPPLGPEFGAFFGARHAELIVGNTFSYTVLREGEEVKLEAEVVEIEKSRLHQVAFDEGASEKQLALRQAWLKPAE
ncbi:MAG: hypothetical protein GY816_11615, partial [Cytophagales bacterium]|nr:hypothetical protein [Cytophagales bacterium]